MRRITSKLKLLAAALPVVATLALAAAPVAVNAATVTEGGISEGADKARGKDQGTNLFGDEGIFKTITNVLLFLVGAISVIMLVYGGIIYTTSGGNQEMVTKAKNTIMYAIIGIIVALLAFAVVNFVTGELKSDSGV